MLSDNTAEKQGNAQENKSQEIDSDEQQLVSYFLCCFCACALAKFCRHH